MYRFTQTALPFAFLMLVVVGLMAGVIGHVLVIRDAHRRDRQSFLLTLLVPPYAVYYAIARLSHPRRRYIQRAFLGGYAVAAAAFYVGAIAT